MWLCIFLAAQNGAFTSTAPKKLIVPEQHSEAIVEETLTRLDDAKKNGEVEPENNKIKRLEDSLKLLEAEKNTFMTALLKIKKDIKYKDDDLAKLPANVQRIHQSKREAEKKLEKMQALYQQKTKELNKKTDEYKDSDRSNQESIDKFK
eukprot:738264_1